MPFPRRLPRTFRRAPLALAATLGIGALLAACGGGAPPAPPQSQGLVLTKATPQHIALTNQFGRTVSLADLKGKAVVLAPFLTLCQDECPLVLAAFDALRRDVDAAGLGHKVVFVEVTVDPGRDTVARLAAYQKEYGADWDLWTGPAASLGAFWKDFGVSYLKVQEAKPAHLDWMTGQPLTYDVDHTDGYILINAAGKERFVDANAPNLHGHLSQKLTALLNAGGVAGLHHPQGQEWTLNDALASISWLLGTNISPAS
ncbi:MAG TPA: SCO family protein [Acidimicrobiales bacterium]|jgi:protein SCO1/2|nr:SCO family protein [Acidimicrobiales bacterium]